LTAIKGSVNISRDNPLLSADKIICRTAENRGLNRISGKVTAADWLFKPALAKIGRPALTAVASWAAPGFLR